MSNKIASALIEKKAITILKQMLMETKRIDPHISENDTQISWDGELYYYADEKKFATKECTGRIPVQIKGDTIGKVKNGKLKKSVEIADLKNYKNDGGCIYFVVHQQLEAPPVIYYEILLPLDLKNILDKKGLQKTTTIELNPFPMKNSAIFALMQSFLSNREKQISTVQISFDPKNPDEKSSKLISDSIESGIDPYLITLIRDGDDFFKNSLEIPTYVYVNTRIGIQVPVERIQIGAISLGHYECALLVNGIQYYNHADITQYKNKYIFSFGKSITIESPLESVKSDMKFNFSEKGTLFERINDYKFWIAICSKDAQVVCEDLFKGTPNINSLSDELNSWKESLKHLEQAKDALEYFGVYDDLKVEELTEKDLKFLHVLVKASLGEKVALKIDRYSPITHFNISHLSIAVLIVKAETNGMYKIYNFFDSHRKIENCFIKLNGQKYPASPYLILSKDNLIENSNTDYKVIYDSIVSVSFIGLYEANVSSFLLEAISAYDKTKSEKIFDFITKLSTWLLKKNHNDMNFLNQLQVFKRKRQLNEEEQQKLYEIFNQNESTLYKIGACILLEKFSKASILWKNLEQQEKEYVKNNPCFPILELWTKDKPEF